MLYSFVTTKVTNIYQEIKHFAKNIHFNIAYKQFFSYLCSRLIV